MSRANVISKVSCLINFISLPSLQVLRVLQSFIPNPSLLEVKGQLLGLDNLKYQILTPYEVGNPVNFVVLVVGNGPILGISLKQNMDFVFR